MRRMLTLAVVLSLAAACFAAEKKAPPKPQPKVEVAFVLDTTGSMSGLIAAAKAKIWSIANQIVLGKPKPIVKMGLVAYRDKGDAYVTKVFDLTDNIDRVYTDLMKFQAGGGGDTPENVNQALHDATHKLSWSEDRKTLKIIYLVGDCPPHNEYKDVPTYDKTAKAAIEKGIYVNTILCGANATARKIWKEIALAAEGSFLNIDAGGGVKEIPTPYDGELAKLNTELTCTVVVYGSKAEQRRNAKLHRDAGRYRAPAAAARATYVAASGKAGAGDLVDAVREKRADLDKLAEAELPENMQKMSKEERKKFLAARQAKRDEITKQITALSAKRAGYIKKKMAEMAKASKAPAESFDGKVVDTLRRQAARKGIHYED